MTTYTKFKEYIWLVNTIYHVKAITFAEINECWLKTDMSEGVEMARTTFYRHKCAIEDIFGIYIECDKKNGNKYYIGNEYVLREDSVQKGSRGQVIDFPKQSMTCPLDLCTVCRSLSRFWGI